MAPSMFTFLTAAAAVFMAMFSLTRGCLRKKEAVLLIAATLALSSLSSEAYRNRLDYHGARSAGVVLLDKSGKAALTAKYGVPAGLAGPVIDFCARHRQRLLNREEFPRLSEVFPEAFARMRTAGLDLATASPAQLTEAGGNPDVTARILAYRAKATPFERRTLSAMPALPASVSGRIMARSPAESAQSFLAMMGGLYFPAAVVLMLVMNAFFRERRGNQVIPALCYFFLGLGCVLLFSAVDLVKENVTVVDNQVKFASLALVVFIVSLLAFRKADLERLAREVAPLWSSLPILALCGVLFAFKDARHPLHIMAATVLMIAMPLFMAHYQAFNRNLIERHGVRLDGRMLMAMLLPPAFICGTALLMIVRSNDFGPAMILLAGTFMAAVSLVHGLGRSLALGAGGAALITGSAFLLLLVNPVARERLTERIGGFLHPNITTTAQGNPFFAAINGYLAIGRSPTGLGAILPSVPFTGDDWAFTWLVAQMGAWWALAILGLWLLFVLSSLGMARSVSDQPFKRNLVLFTGFVVGFMALWYIGGNLLILPPSGIFFPGISRGGWNCMFLAMAMVLMFLGQSRTVKAFSTAGFAWVRPASFPSGAVFVVFVLAGLFAWEAAAAYGITRMTREQVLKAVMEPVYVVDNSGRGERTLMNPIRARLRNTLQWGTVRDRTGAVLFSQAANGGWFYADDSLSQVLGFICEDTGAANGLLREWQPILTGLPALEPPACWKSGRWPEYLDPVEVECLLHPQAARRKNIYPRPGEVTASFDLSLQRAAAARLKEVLEGRRQAGYPARGFALVGNGKGEVLAACFYPYPTYRQVTHLLRLLEKESARVPLAASEKAELEVWKHLGFLADGLSRPKTPGSVAKAMTAIPLTARGLQNFTVHCTGFRCWRAHGTIGFHEALTLSCNTYNARAGRLLGENLYDFYRNTCHFSLDVVEEEIRRGAGVRDAFYAPFCAFGQGSLQYRPGEFLQAAEALGTGTAHRLNFLLAHVQGRVRTEYRPIESFSVPARSLALIRPALGDVVRRGTAVAFQVSPPYPDAGGKTGSPEVFALVKAGGKTKVKRDVNSVFIGWTGFEKPDTVAAVYAETHDFRGMIGGGGPAGYVAKSVFLERRAELAQK